MSSTDNSNSTILAALLTSGQPQNQHENAAVQMAFDNIATVSDPRQEDCDFETFGDFDVSEFLRLTDVPTQSSSGPQQMELQISHASPPVIHIIENKRISKRRATIDVPSTSTKRRKGDGADTSRTSKAPRKSRQSKKSSATLVAPPEIVLPTNHNMEIDFSSSLATLRSYGEMKKKSKRSLQNGENTLKKCADINNRLDEEMKTVYSLHEQIARLQNEADTLTRRIEKDRQNNDHLSKQTEGEVHQSRTTYEAVSAIYERWRKEVDKAFQSDSD